MTQYEELLKTEEVTLEFQEEAIHEIATIGRGGQRPGENIGARRLHTIMEKLLEEVSFEAPDMHGVTVTVTPNGPGKTPGYSQERRPEPLYTVRLSRRHRQREF